MTVAMVVYFGAYTIWGNRGVLALRSTRAQLDIQQEQLSQLKDKSARLDHRIALINQDDPDLVQELARGQLMDGAPNQVAMPRDSH